MDRRIPINVSVTPSEYSGRSIRLGNSDGGEKMRQRMREFEEESRRWRDQFMSQSGLSHSSMIDRPRMFFNFPEFPELSSNFGAGPISRMGASPFPQSSSIMPSTHKSFMEEDDHGAKKYKIQFDIGDFKPSEIQVRTEGRQLIVKGDRELVAGSASESKQFNREITLPDFIEPTSVTSYLNDNGVLTVEAPVLMDRLGYNTNNSITASSAMRQSPFRDNSSPSRIGQMSLMNSSFNNAFNTPFFNDSPSISISTNSNSSPALYKFNMSEFRPEDIAITVTDTTLKVHAVREENESRGTGKSYREFKREIGLPYGADVKRLKNSLQPDGTLTIEIPVQDNNNLRPPLSPTGINRQFGNFSLNDNNNNNTSTSIMTTSNLNTNGGLIDHSNNGRELRLTFDLAGYKPEDVNIKVIDNNTLKVHAVHIDNTRGNQIHREYTRQYILPEWVQPELLRSRMSDNGTLTVEVPMPQNQPSKYERVINIQNSAR
jgi:HSP20 family molecular chaperone IbpA